MEKVDYKEQDRKLKEFQAEITSLYVYGDDIKKDFIIHFKGPWYSRLPVFGFKTGENIPRGIRETCYEIFYKYFPNCDTCSL